LEQSDRTTQVSAMQAIVERIGYDGPVHAEPFNAALRALPREAACAATAAAMKKAFAL
jgi:predicted xylose isomerase-like sugar epimerase